MSHIQHITMIQGVVTTNFLILLGHLTRQTQLDAKSWIQGNQTWQMADGLLNWH